MKCLQSQLICKKPLQYNLEQKKDIVKSFALCLIKNKQWTITTNFLNQIIFIRIKIIIAQLMIDGVYPSQVQEVEQLRHSHYRNLKNIINNHSFSISFPSPRFIEITKTKKANHKNWKTFIQVQDEQKNYKRNLSLYDKLNNISIKRSRYTVKTEVKSPKDPLLHHNSLYECQRRFQSIDQTNSLIAYRIANTKGDIDNKKLQAQFRINKLNVSRLQKFDRLKRLNRIVNRSFEKKFSNQSPRPDSYFLTQENPQSF